MRRADPRRHRRAAIVAALLLVLATLTVFLKQNPLAGGYRIRGVLASANQLKTGSEVRIAGLRVGRVVDIDASPDGTAVVELQIDDLGRPLAQDATLAVKPRLVLEGNAYVELAPGSLGAEPLPDDGVIPLSRTSVAPQLDQALNVFDVSTRDALHGTIGAFATGLDGGGARGLRRWARELDRSLASVRHVARAARGTRPGDLSFALGESGDVTRQLAADPRALAGMVTNIRRVSGALAAEDEALAASIDGFDDVLRAAPAGLAALDGALPELTRLAAALRPALRSAPPALRGTTALLRQIGGLARRRELGGLVAALDPVTAELPTLERRLGVLFGELRRVTDCIATHVVPTANMEIEDGRHTTGDPVWLDAAHGLTGFSSFSSAVDANGGTVRLGITGGDQAVQGIIPGLGAVAGFMPRKPLGVRPTWLGYGVEPPYRPDQPCAEQELPDLSKRSGPPPDWRLAPVGSG